MSEEEIKRQLKLSKQQNKNERYDYLCSQFNCVNYAIKLEKYTNKLQQENQKYKEVINKAIEFLYKIKFDKTDKYICISEYIEYQQLLDILKESE